MHTFLLTWDGSDGSYPPADYAAAVAATAAGQEVAGTWRMRRLRVGHAAGDRVFLLRQGKNEPGIIASGRLTTAPRRPPSSTGSTDQVFQAKVIWEHVVALQDRLPLAQVKALPGSHHWDNQSSGHEVHSPVDRALAARWDKALTGLHGNAAAGGSLPDWTWDETLLTYELYLQDYADPLRYPDATHPAVHELSTLLRQLPLHPHALRADPRFRNPSGVARKIQNLMWEATARRFGSPHSSAMDRQVVTGLPDPVAVRTIAAAVRTASSQLGNAPVVLAGEEPDGAVEGAILEYSHRRRERDRKIVQRKKDQLRRAGQPLVCEACGVDVAKRYDLAAGSGVECHHVLPLASGVRRTRLADLALVCPTCHRALHSRSRWDSVQQLQAHLH